MDLPPAEEHTDRRPPAPEPGNRPWLTVVLPIAWLVLGFLGGYLVIAYVGSGDDTPPALETTTGPSKSADAQAASSKPKPKPKPKRTEPTAEPTTEAATEAPVTRSVTVSVYNQIGIGGLARRIAGQAQAAGWPIGAVSDWRVGSPSDTIYYPAGLQREAELLGSDLGIGRVMPSLPAMSSSQLTVVLASPR